MIVFQERPPGSVALSRVADAAKSAWDHMMQRAATDKTYRSQLLANPVETMRHGGIPVPDGLQVTLIEWDPKHANLFLPAPPANSGSTSR